jgi:hypothetical protein
MNAVGTYYKPSERRGKRVVYRSTDPDEPKWERMMMIRSVIAVVIVFAIIFLGSRYLT